MPLDGNAWNTAVPDWEDRIRNGDSLLPDLPLFEGPAQKALNLFDTLRVPDMPGTPLRKDITPDWVREYIATIFGCYDPETRRRMIQEFFLMIPKKNTKSDLAATIILIAAVLNDRPKAELVLVAPSHNVAEIAFDQIAGMIALDPELGGVDGIGKQGGLFLVQSHLKKITHKTTKARIKIESADGDIVTGSKAAFVLVDETHELAAKAKAPKVLTELKGGLSSRPEGFFLQITTQSKIEPSGQFKKELMEARAVRDGKVSSPLLAVIYELPRDMQKSEAWKDESTWGLVNPNLDVSVDLGYLRREFEKATRGGPEDLALFASQHLNVEIGLGLHSDRWVGAEDWMSCAGSHDLDQLLEACEVVVIGGDIGGADDLYAMTVIGREKETLDWRVWTRAWCLDVVLKRRKEIAPRLLDFQEDGDLRITDNSEVHNEEAAELCSYIQSTGLLPIQNGIGLDQWGVAALRNALFRAGFTDEQVVGVQQGFKLNGAIKGLERMLYDGTIIHGNQPILNWSVANAKAIAKGNNIMITKQTAGTAKIDPLLALFNAAMLMNLNPEASGGQLSPWETPGFSVMVAE